MQRIELNLPWPPSINSLWRMGRGAGKSGKPNWYVTKQADDYREAVLWQLRVQKPSKFASDARLRVDLFLHAPNNRSFDVDNRFKLVGDILQEAEIYANDSQIDELFICRREIIKPNGCINLFITKIEPLSAKD